MYTGNGGGGSPFSIEFMPHVVPLLVLGPLEPHSYLVGVDLVT